MKNEVKSTERKLIRFLKSIINFFKKLFMSKPTSKTTSIENSSFASKLKSFFGLNRIKTRHFGGKLTNFKSKEERSYEQKHLRAYLKGNSQFRHGFDNSGFPVWHKVKEVWK